MRKRFLAGGVNHESPSFENISSIVRTRSQIFDTMTKWITQGGGAQDALDDPALYAAVLDFLKRPTEPIPDDAEGSVKHGLTLLDDMRKVLLATFTAQTLRPLARTTLVTDHKRSRSIVHAYGAEPPDIDKVTAEELVNNLDAMAGAAFRNVVQEVPFLIDAYVYCLLSDIKCSLPL